LILGCEDSYFLFNLKKFSLEKCKMRVIFRYFRSKNREFTDFPPILMIIRPWFLKKYFIFASEKDFNG